MFFAESIKKKKEEKVRLLLIFDEKMLRNFLQKTHAKKVLETSLHVGTVVFGVVKSTLWPIYSAAALTSVFFLLCSSMEKQMLADHFFGNEKEMEDKKDTLLSDSKKLFHEELSTAVKERVWQLPSAAFKEECQERNIE